MGDEEDPNGFNRACPKVLEQDLSDFTVSYREEVDPQKAEADKKAKPAKGKPAKKADKKAKAKPAKKADKKAKAKPAKKADKKAKPKAKAKAKPAKKGKKK